MYTLKIELPDDLAARLKELVEAGWFTSEEEIARLALVEFVGRRRFELQERFQREDIAWALEPTAETGDLKRRLRKDRPMTTVSLRMPEDVVEDLKRIASRLEFTSYEALLRAYVGQGLRRHLGTRHEGDHPSERHGDEEPVLLDPLEHRLLQGLAGLAPGRQGQDEVMQDLLRRYLASEISLGKVADMLGVSRFELTERFKRLGVPMRIGPATLEEARDEVKVARDLE